MRLRKQLSKLDLLILDELGYVVGVQCFSLLRSVKRHLP
jgi:DNA replication protein DnaC